MFAIRNLFKCGHFLIISQSSQRSRSFLIFLFVLCGLCERSNGPSYDHARFFYMHLSIPLVFYMTAAAGGRPDVAFSGLKHVSMAKGTAAVKCFPQRGYVVLFLGVVTFTAAEFFALDINEFTGFVVRVVMTDSTACIRQIIGMDCMRKSHQRPS